MAQQEREYNYPSNKESIYLLQKVDANCNNCKFMIRDNEKLKQSQERHHAWQLDYFNAIKNKLIKKAKEHKEKNDIKLHDKLIKEAEEMKFQFDKKEAMINYGRCDKLNKNISFIPNTCQIDTQDCFEHRNETGNNIQFQLN